MRTQTFFIFLVCLVGCTDPEISEHQVMPPDASDAGSDSSTSSDAGLDSSVPSTQWPNGCDWCNGPGCEQLDEPCQNVESGSRGVTCPNGITLTPADHCFPTNDKWDRPILCCCEPDTCPGV